MNAAAQTPFERLNALRTAIHKVMDHALDHRAADFPDDRAYAAVTRHAHAPMTPEQLRELPGMTDVVHAAYLEVQAADDATLYSLLSRYYSVLTGATATIKRLLAIACTSVNLVTVRSAVDELDHDTVDMILRHMVYIGDITLITREGDISDVLRNATLQHGGQTMHEARLATYS